MKPLPALLCSSALALWSCGGAGAADDPVEPVAFLSPPLRPSTTAILPPAPAPGSPGDEADRRVFRETRRLERSPRWALAIGDVRLSVPAMLANFSCATGVHMTPAETPVLAGLLTRLSADAEGAIEPAKQANRRRRPLLVDAGPTCEPREKLARSWDYPSGHATWGWAVGLVLAELVPERSTQVLIRARVYAESRVVCGAHNLSAIQAGAVNAAALVAALHGSADFRAAMEAARAEIAARAAARRGPSPFDCAAESAAARTPF